MALRYKEPKVSEENYLLDTIENILSNKLTAVIGRDNPKDIFDIYLIWKNYKINWCEICRSAHQKAGFLDVDCIVNRSAIFPEDLNVLYEFIDIDRFEAIGGRKKRDI